MYPHRIRLRGPWEAEPLDGSAAPGRRILLPSPWAASGLVGAGAVRLRRRFHAPRRLDAWERIVLRCREVIGPATWRLNGVELALAEADRGEREAEITALVGERNELVGELEEPRADATPWEEIALEIRCRAYLRGVQVVARHGGSSWQLETCGEVVREIAGDPLEVYVLFNGSTVHYMRVSDEGLASRLSVVVPVPDAIGSPAAVRVDLVNAASIWYTVEAVVEVVD